MDTIAAIASPPGAGRRGVLRVSGPRARALVEACFTPLAPPLVLRRGAQRGRLDDGRGSQPALFLWMPAPASYTREDVAELHLCGAPPLVAAALERLCALGARTAAPGEFTRRAFLNGRIDLSRAEGVLALVEARDADALRAARRLLDGGLARRVEALREALDELRALSEASLDFDEAETGHVPAAELLEGADALARRLADALAGERARAAPAGLPRVLLFGAPSAGKSSLWNALGGGQALVSDLRGTTRDVNEAVWRCGGRAVVLCDAPGLDARAGGTDAAAQRLLARERDAAELVLWVVDASAARAGALAEEARALGGAPRVVAWTKTDRAGAPRAPAPALRAALGEADVVAVSATARTGLAELEARAAQALARGARAAGGGRELFERHREALAAAADALAAGRAALAGGAPLDLVAQAFREAGRALERIEGRTTPEDLLERIFARFCIGK